MKNKYMLILVFAFSLVILLNSAFACISPPTIKTKSGCELSYEGYDWYDPIKDNSYFSLNNETHIFNFINEKKEECNFSEEDVNILTDFISNGYSVIEQDEEEYKIFLDEANKANKERPEFCLAYEAVAHRGRWTGLQTGSMYVNGSCVRALCGGGLKNIIWNDLKKQVYISLWIKIVGLVILACVILFILLQFRKKSVSVGN